MAGSGGDRSGPAHRAEAGGARRLLFRQRRHPVRLSQAQTAPEDRRVRRGLLSLRLAPEPDRFGRGAGGRAATENASEVQLVAHSMGGLVARAALTSPAGGKVKRLIMLGTPNYGSFASGAGDSRRLDVVRKLPEWIRDTPLNSRRGGIQYLPGPARNDALAGSMRDHGPVQSGGVA